MGNQAPRKAGCNYVKMAMQQMKREGLQNYSEDNLNDYTRFVAYWGSKEPCQTEVESFEMRVACFWVHRLAYFLEEVVEVVIEKEEVHSLGQLDICSLTEACC